VRYVREWRHKSLRLTGPLSFDFALEEQKVLIEFDGVQHAEPSCFFAATDEEALRAFELQPALDRAKDEWAREHGWTLIRLTTLVTVEAELIKHGIIHRAAA
jgi:very-short-patch-repair endonuclease